MKDTTFVMVGHFFLDIRLTLRQRNGLFLNVPSFHRLSGVVNERMHMCLARFQRKQHLSIKLLRLSSAMVLYTQSKIAMERPAFVTIISGPFGIGTFRSTRCDGLSSSPHSS